MLGTKRPGGGCRGDALIEGWVGAAQEPPQPPFSGSPPPPGPSSVLPVSELRRNLQAPCGRSQKIRPRAPSWRAGEAMVTLGAGSVPSAPGL